MQQDNAQRAQAPDGHRSETGTYKLASAATSQAFVFSRRSTGHSIDFRVAAVASG